MTEHDVRATTVFPDGPHDEQLLMYDRAACDAWILSSAFIDFERLRGTDPGPDLEGHTDHDR